MFQSGFYELQLAYLAGACVLASLIERRIPKRSARTEKETERLENGKRSFAVHALSSLSRKYLVVYAIVMGADWLQGPYVYSLYREQYQFPERTVALLFVTGFISAGLTAPLTGVWADQYGRRRLCLYFCASYCLACVCILFPWLPVLLIGRVLGGISTSILFSAFESWLISSANGLALPQADLSSVLGRATLINGFVAAGAGVFSNKLVAVTGTFASPFISSGALLVLGWAVIRSTWAENYGSGGGAKSPDIFQLKRISHAWRIVRSDSQLLVLGLTQTCFEGSMYLFVFLWVPSLQEVASKYPAESLPLGYIFSSFMFSMMIGSVLYTAITSYALSRRSSSNPKAEPSLVVHGMLSSAVCAVSSLSFAVSVKANTEHVRFWAFCVFEACVGMYYPVQGMLRGTLIANEHRATLSSLFRVPLNIFVVISLLTGVSAARHAVLTACSLMLAFSSIMVATIIANC